MDNGIYQHHMLVIEVVDKNTVLVIHYTGPEAGKASINLLAGTSIVKEEECDLRDGGFELVSYREDVCLYSTSKAIQRARSRVGEQKYSIFHNNCESLVNWALTNEDQTDQGTFAVAATGTAVGVGVLATAIYGVYKIFGSGSGEKEDHPKRRWDDHTKRRWDDHTY